jgi:hypothetical protein
MSPSRVISWVATACSSGDAFGSTGPGAPGTADGKGHTPPPPPPGGGSFVPVVVCEAPEQPRRTAGKTTAPRRDRWLMGQESSRDRADRRVSIPRRIRGAFVCHFAPSLTCLPWQQLRRARPLSEKTTSGNFWLAACTTSGSVGLPTQRCSHTLRTKAGRTVRPSRARTRRSESRPWRSMRSIRCLGLAEPNLS